MRQRMELTRTNRSCGLTTYFSSHLELALRVVGATGPTAGLRGAPGEGQSRHTELQTITQIPIEMLV